MSHANSRAVAPPPLPSHGRRSPSRVGSQGALPSSRTLRAVRRTGARACPRAERRAREQKSLDREAPVQGSRPQEADDDGGFPEDREDKSDDGRDSKKRALVSHSFSFRSECRCRHNRSLLLRAVKCARPRTRSSYASTSAVDAGDVADAAKVSCRRFAIAAAISSCTARADRRRSPRQAAR